MALTSGTRLGPYEIESPLGAGGMGEVYRARDTRLGRDVAIKVLPQHLASNPDLKARFGREAKAISALNHPHICTLHDVGHQDGIDFLVMELLEGETLADRLQRGPLPLKQALETGIEIAEALEKAHKNSILHRDLKPGNIMLTKSGAKLLDFGLAKPKLEAVAAVASSSSGKLTPSTPTMSVAALSKPAAELTQQGTIVGTFQYMAPEVLQGQEADARSDIFSFGCVLYEMVTGRKAFAGKSQLSVLTAILEKEPEPLAPEATAIQHTIDTCLSKDPEERWQTAREVARELRWLSRRSEVTPAPAPRMRWRWQWGAVVAISLMALLAGTIFYVARPGKPKQLIRAYIPVPEKVTFSFHSDVAGPVVISPDGSTIAFAADDAEGKHLLWVRELNGNSARVMAGTEGASFPFWSPDSHRVGFFADAKLKIIDLTSGALTAVCDAPQGRGGSWNGDGTIIFSPSFLGGLYKVTAAGGTAVQVTKVDTTKHDSHRWPAFLPDGKHFLFLALNHRMLNDPSDAVYLGSLDGRPPIFVMPSTLNALFNDGWLLFMKGNQLMAQQLDPDRGILLGSGIRIADDVQNDPTTWHGSFDVSANGVLVHGNGGGAEGQLTWFDMTGKKLGTVGRPEVAMFNVSLSPKGDLVATEASTDIWVQDLARNVRSRLTSNGENQNPIVSPDGEWVAFAGFVDLERESADGAGNPEVLLKGSEAVYPNDWSLDGKFLLYTAGLNGNGQVVKALPIDGKRTAVTVTPRKEGSDQSDASFSPDGRWVSYASTESGRPEVYIVPFNRTGRRWQVSTGGGDRSRWSRDGKALFYLALDNTLMMVPVSISTETLQLGTPRPLFRVPVIASNLNAFDVSADGKRFLVAATVEQQSAPLTLVVNWDAELKK